MSFYLVIIFIIITFIILLLTIIDDDNKEIIIEIDNDTYKRFISRLFIYKYYNDRFIVRYKDNFDRKDEVNSIIRALNIKDKEKRLSYIYDVVCDRLDDLLKDNYCEFKNNKCLSDRTKSFEKTCGCCVNNKKEACPYFLKDHCTVKCSGCKFYLCPLIKKKKGSIRLRDIPITYLLSIRQRFILRYTLFTPKEEIIRKMIMFRI